jgi:H+-translocating NAD(P) transhydrogenase subunit alpha
LSTALVTDLTIFVLALLIGIEVIGKVPATLHTPLMSAANSIHGIVLVGALLIGVTSHTVVGYVLAFVASFFAAANVVGGYAVTGRMLKMFRRRGGPMAESAIVSARQDAISPGGTARWHRGPAPDHPRPRTPRGGQPTAGAQAAEGNGHGPASQARP